MASSDRCDGSERLGQASSSSTGTVVASGPVANAETEKSLNTPSRTLDASIPDICPQPTIEIPLLFSSYFKMGHYGRAIRSTTSRVRPLNTHVECRETRLPSYV